MKLFRPTRTRPITEGPAELDGTRIFVISLADATQRRSRFAENALTGLPWTFFDGSTDLDSGLRYDSRRAMRLGGRSLTGSELGCYSSHYRLWRALVDDLGADRYLILEDDVVADWPFLERLANAPPDEVPWPLLRLWFTIPAPTRKVHGPFFETYQVTELLKHGYGAVAYLIDKRAAAKLVAALSEVVSPVDLAMEQAWRHGVRNLALFPFPVLHPMGLSQIGVERWNDAPKPLSMKLERGARRLIDRMRRALWHWRGTVR